MKSTLTPVLLFLTLIAMGLQACKDRPGAGNPNYAEKKMNRKIVVYQVFTRLFGNTNTTNTPWGTKEENGVGKFSDFDDTALSEIRDLGVTHIWYTGVPHHAVIGDYTEYGISNDDPDVVKGRAGSPYAVKDYYNVNPDLAEDPARRLEEFEALVGRTHAHGMKVIIDIVPNHVARHYQGLSNPPGVTDFGSGDDTSVEYARDNNFYYIPGEPFRVPELPEGIEPLGGESHPLADGKFEEYPAKWTGNGSRKAQPHYNDWYETVKINYGVRPDGTYDFDLLPEELTRSPASEHYRFWSDKDVPDSWIKFRDITLYWLEKGVDGFRFDMAEMVPVEFWSYLNSHIKQKNPDAFLLAEVYNPDLYRDYLFRGHMDYLYDKVDLYDSIKHIMKGYGWTDHIAVVQDKYRDIEHHLLHFLENHDEQRIASPEFAGRAEIGKPAMVVSATIGSSPTLVYFGQELGEPGAEDGGFGDPSRTSIFDYVGVPHLQRWVNDKRFDGGESLPAERDLRDFYKRLLNATLSETAFMGDYREIHFYNKEQNERYDHRIFSYVRWNEDARVVVAANFDTVARYELDLKLPPDLLQSWGLNDGEYPIRELLYGRDSGPLRIEGGVGHIPIALAPLESVIFRIQ